MVRTEYSAVRKTEVRGFLLLSLLIAVIVLAAVLAHEKGKEKHAGVINGGPKGSGKRSYFEFYC